MYTVIFLREVRKIHRKRAHSTFIFYLTAVVFLWLKTYLMYQFYFQLNVEGVLDQFILWLNPLSSALLILGLSFFFGKRLRPGWVLLISFISTMILYADILYYRFYIDFVTVPVLFQLKNVGGLGSSTVELLSFADILLFVDLIFLAIWWKKGKWTPIRVRKKQKLTVLGAAIVFLLANIGLVYADNPHLLKNFYNRDIFVKAFGAFNYHAYDIAAQTKPVADRALANNSDLDRIKHYVNHNEIPANSDLFGAAKNKNVILISLESTQNFVIDRKVNGQEVTPFLNKLTQNSYYFDHFYHQTEQGKTSDAEFLIDNSMYGLPSGSVFVRYPKNTYQALPEILRKHHYTSAVFHGNRRSFWNRGQMYKALGYDRFFSERDFDVTDQNSINFGIKDIPFFKQSMPKMKSLKQPFYAKLLMMSNHFPFEVAPKDRMMTPPNTDVGVVNRYFTSVRYEDEAVKRLFKQLKESGLYKNSIVILYGDHYGISEAYEDGLEQVFDKKLGAVDRTKLQRVPLIIHIPGQEGKTIHTVAGQVDIRPTLLHLLGIKTDSFIHFGHDLFSEEKDNLAFFRNGDFVTKNYIYTANTCYNKKNRKKVSIQKCKPWFERRDTELNDSDSILYEDLFQFKKK